MIIDCCFKTREKAQKQNEGCKEHWKYYGTAKNPDGTFIAWRTNDKKHLNKLLSGNDDFYSYYSDVEVDSKEQHDNMKSKHIIIKGVEIDNVEIFDNNIIRIHFKDGEVIDAKII